jgi:diacylglycerol O-acyltransferase / wax synthase
MPDRLSPLDASFLTIEDGVSHMHIGSVAIFEGPAPRHEEVQRMVAGKLPLVPRYRQVVRTVPAGLGLPVWVDDPHFNIEYHVRRTALPAPGGEAELRRLVGRLMSQPLDRAKPLWEIWVTENLEQDSWAMVCKTHHSLVDGVSGAELLAVIMDVSPDRGPQPDPPEWNPVPPPDGLRLVFDSLTSSLRRPVEVLSTMQAAAAVPRRAAGRVLEVAMGSVALAGLLRAAPSTSLNGPIGSHRRWDWASARVDDVKAVRRALGGTFNDVVLAAIAAGFRRLLISRGEAVTSPIRTMVPVSVRARDESGMAVGDSVFNNRVSAMFADLPVQLDDPVERLRQISVQMAGLKDARQAVAGEALTSLAGFAPPMLLSLGTRMVAAAATRGFNTITTNVPGPQLPLYVLGRRLLKAFPYVPITGGIRVAVAIFSYNGQVNFGVTGDYDTVPDLAVLCRGIERGLHELSQAASQQAGGAAAGVTVPGAVAAPRRHRARPRSSSGGRTRANGSRPVRRR